MKRLLVLVAVVLSSREMAVAGKSASCCKSPPVVCNSGVQWYQAKDGTFREQLPYWTAQSRAEDADDMEIRLRAVESELAATKAETLAIQQTAERQKVEFEAQIAKLRLQLGSEQQLAASQQDRAEKVEAAHQQSVARITELTIAQQKSEERLDSARSELKAVSDERDALRTANANLQQTVARLTESRDASVVALKVAQDTMNRMKQEAAESKKPEVQEEPGEQKDGEDPQTAGGNGTEEQSSERPAAGTESL